MRLRLQCLKRPNSLLVAEIPCVFAHVSEKSLATAVAMMWYTQASKLREIACLSLASNLVLVYVLISVPIEGIRNSPEGRTMTDRLLLWNTSAGLLDYGYTFGAVAFCYCEFTLLLCIQEDMKHKEDFERVVGASFSISAVIGVGFAAVGYWAFGAEVKELVYLNFPPGSPMSTICITSYNLILIASYLLFLTPVFLFVKGAFPSVPYSICRCAVLSGIVSCDAAAIRIWIRIVRCQPPTKRQKHKHCETQAHFFSSPTSPCW